MNPFEDDDNPFDIKPTKTITKNTTSLDGASPIVNNTQQHTPIISVDPLSNKPLPVIPNNNNRNSLNSTPLPVIPIATNNNNNQVEELNPFLTTTTTANQPQTPPPKPNRPTPVAQQQKDNNNNNSHDELNPFLTSTTVSNNNNNNQVEELNPFLTTKTNQPQAPPPNQTTYQQPQPQQIKNTNDELNPFLTSTTVSNNNNNNNSNNNNQSEELNPFLTTTTSNQPQTPPNKPTPTPAQQQNNDFLFKPPPSVVVVSKNNTNTTTTTNNNIKINTSNNNNSSFSKVEDEFNPFLNQESTNQSKKPLPIIPNQQTPPSPLSTNNNNNNQSNDVDNLIKNIKIQMGKEFENKENLYKSNIVKIVQEKESLQLSLDQLNSKFLKLLEENEELKNNNKFIDKHKHILQKDNQQQQQSPTSTSSFNLNQELKKLNNYKTIKEKKEILKQSIISMDMDSILIVLHYIYNNLNIKLFLELILSNSYSTMISNLFEMFLGYLRRIGKFNDVINLQKLINQRNEEIYINLFIALQEKEINKKIINLTNWLENYKNSGGNNNSGGMIVFLKEIENYLTILDRQIKIDQFDSNLANKGDPIFQRIPRPLTLIGKSLSDTIYYCLLYHPNAAKDKLSSPISYKEIYNVSNKIYLYNQLLSRSRLSDWNYINTILPKKKGIFTKSFVSDLPIEAFIEILSTHNAPLDMIESTARMITDDQRRYECSMQYKLYNIALESLISMKQLKKVQQFRIKLQNNQTILKLLDESLSNSKIKWK